jgi:tRNA(Ile)-lysidine synthase
VPSNNHLIERVALHCAGLFPQEVSLLAAVSGGGDSTALLLILHCLKERLGIDRLGVVHVNHGLRGAASDADESFAAGLAERLGAPFFHKKLAGRLLHDSGIEEWARRERYVFFHAVKEREGYDFIATGHTADDQAETLLFRLMRGTGIRGLRGVLASREDGVVRPVLGLWRHELNSWLKDQKVSFRHDASNDDRAFSRNRIRHDLLPLLNQREKGASEKLVQIAGKAQEFWKVFEPRVGAWIGKYVGKSEGSFRIKKEGFSDRLHASEGLRSVFEDYCIPVDSLHIDEVASRASRKSGFLLLPGGWRYYFQSDMILFCKDPPGAAPAFSCPLAVPGCTVCPERQVRFVVKELASPAEKVPRDNLTVLLDRNICGDRLTFRSWNRTDRFQPLGSGSSTTVREFLAKQKIALIERQGRGIVEGKGGKIVWIPGVRIAHACRLTPGSRKLLKISYQSCPLIT